MTKPKIPCPSEHEEQAAVIVWANLMAARHPVLALLHAIPNGGKRDKRTAAKLKREGVKPGVPDLFLPVVNYNPEGVYHGLYIEMKPQSGGKVELDQKWWHAQLQHQGYRVEVCKGAQAAIEVLSDYLGI